jgi:hypothetical protein
MSLLEELMKIEDQKFLDQVDVILETARLQAERRSMRMRGVTHELSPFVVTNDKGKPYISAWRVTCRWQVALQEGRDYGGIPADSPLIFNEAVTCLFCMVAT